MKLSYTFFTGLSLVLHVEHCLRDALSKLITLLFKLLVYLGSFLLELALRLDEFLLPAFAQIYSELLSSFVLICWFVYKDACQISYVSLVGAGCQRLGGGHICTCCCP